jgi:hypothetical protein
MIFVKIGQRKIFWGSIFYKSKLSKRAFKLKKPILELRGKSSRISLFDAPYYSKFNQIMLL